VSEVRFFAPGIPAPGGSKRAFAHKTTGRIVVMDDAQRNKDWRAVVALAAERAMDGNPPLDGPLGVVLAFVVPRPKGHYGKRGLRRGAPRWPTSKPDTLKLARSTEDAMSRIVYHDDAQTVSLAISKRYGDRPGVEVAVRVLSDEEAA
jgi:Holliday junction resolvase RusA-like endonuclease